jgi:predicted nucleic acid-binding protein
MPETDALVINISPIIALAAALGDLEVLKIYQRVLVPYEVHQELLVGGVGNFAPPEFEAANWLHKRTGPMQIGTALQNMLDLGEATVVQLALENKLSADKCFLFLILPLFLFSFF